MNVQDGTPLVMGAMIALQQGGNEKDVLQFHLSDYIAFQQNSVVVDKLETAPDLAVANVLMPSDQPVTNNTIQCLVIKNIVQSSPDDTSPASSIIANDEPVKQIQRPKNTVSDKPESNMDVNIIPVMVSYLPEPQPAMSVAPNTPYTPPITLREDHRSDEPDSAIDNSQLHAVATTTETAIHNEIPSLMPYMIPVDQPDPSILKPTNKMTDADIKTNNINIPIRAEAKSNDPVVQIPKILPGFDVTSNTEVIRENSNDRIEIDNRELPDSRKLDVQPVTIEITDNPPQTKTAFDAVVTNLADYINKNITIPEGMGFKTSPNSLSISQDSYSNVEKKSDLQSLQYSVGDAGISMKIEAYTAKIKVYPPDLGQVTAEILINKGMTELTLTADNRHVKDFIETNLQQLRETFLDSNINLSQITVQNGTAQEKMIFIITRHQHGQTG